MAATLTTLNVSVEQIEADLRAGKTVADIAQDWSEPPANVYAVQRAMQARGDGNGRGTASPRPPAAAPVVAGARALTSVPHPPTPPAADAGQSGPAVDALVNAAARSSSKRTQALGVKLADLAAVVRQRLADEREQAERAEKERAEREAAAAEVQRLEAQLAEARAKLRPKRQGGGSPVQREKPVAGPFHCSHCDRPFVYAKAHAKHEAACTRTAS